MLLLLLLLSSIPRKLQVCVCVEQRWAHRGKLWSLSEFSTPQRCTPVDWTIRKLPGFSDPFIFLQCFFFWFYAVQTINIWNIFYLTKKSASKLDVGVSSFSLYLLDNLCWYENSGKMNSILSSVKF